MLAMLPLLLVASQLGPVVATLPRRPAPAVAPAAATTYTVDSLAADIYAVLAHHPVGERSGRALGNPDNRKLWTRDKVQSLFDGLVVAQARFYPEFSLQELARLVVAEGAQESTGDYRLGVVPTDLSDWRSQGFLQATPGSVLVDYLHFGQPIADANGKVLLRPEDAPHFDLGEPRTNVLLWAWYTKNSVLAGVSLNEWANRAAWNIKVGGVTRDYGNAPFTWLAGPHNDRHRDGKNFVDYYNRIADYYIQTGFGDQATFDALLARTLRPDMVLIHDAVSK